MSDNQIKTQVLYDFNNESHEVVLLTDALELEAERDTLLAELSAYKSAVIVLEDGAEPEVGDWVLIREDDNAPDYGSSIDHYEYITKIDKAAEVQVETTSYSYYNYGVYVGKIIKITERNNLPVIYKSALKGKGGA